MTTPGPTNTSFGADIRISAVSTRNAILCAFSIFNTSVVIVLLVTTTRLKQVIKISLLHLLVTDIAVMIPGLVYAVFVQTKLDSGHPFCVTVVFFTINGFFLNHAAVAAISLNNFLAVFYALKHNLMVTTKTLLLGVAMMWIVLSLITGCCIAVNFPVDKPCVVLANIPRYGAVVVFCVLLILDISVCIMNLSLCSALRKRRQVHVNRVFAVNGGNNRQSLNPATVSPAIRRSIEGESDHTISNQTLNDYPDASSSLNTSLSGRTSGEDSRNLLTVPKPSYLLRALYYPNEHVVQVGNVDTSKDEQNKETDKGREDFKKKKHLWPILESVREFTKASKMQRTGSFHFDRSRAQNTSLKLSQSRSNQSRRMSISMIIICLWCCVFNVPCLFFLFYVAFIAEDRINANYSPVGILCTTLLVTNVLGDPFIYVWRFVPWRNVIKKVRGLCRSHR